MDEVRCEWCNATPARWFDLGGGNLCKACRQAAARKARPGPRGSTPWYGPLPYSPIEDKAWRKP